MKIPIQIQHEDKKFNNVKDTLIYFDKIEEWVNDN